MIGLASTCPVRRRRASRSAASKAQAPTAAAGVQGRPHPVRDSTDGSALTAATDPAASSSRMRWRTSTARAVRGAARGSARRARPSNVPADGAGSATRSAVGVSTPTASAAAVRAFATTGAATSIGEACSPSAETATGSGAAGVAGSAAAGSAAAGAAAGAACAAPALAGSWAFGGSGDPATGRTGRSESGST
jgi:hypothetical protein